MNLFIDTNIFLAFFHFASDDLDELKKLSRLLSEGSVKLHLTAQVEDEFRRNRANKIHDALKQFREVKVAATFPQFCKDYSQYEQLKRLQKEFKTTHNELVKTVNEDILAERLKADLLIGSLFGLAHRIETTDALFAYAWRRVALGNPPGKAGSLASTLAVV